MTSSGNEEDTFYEAQLSEVWKQRALQFGARCVINLSHPVQDFDLITEKQKQLLFPYLSSALAGSETSLLDYGCGPGRFTVDLERFVNGGQVIGFDVCQELLDLAPRSPNVRYTSSSTELASQSYKDFFDVIWICIVLGGIPDEKCTVIAEGLTRTLKPNGLIFLVEHTSDVNPGNNFWKFRPLDQYTNMFPRVTFHKVGEYFDFNAEVSVMSGRKTG